MSKNGILVELGYTENEATINQVKDILSKSDFGDSEISKIINLNDKIKIYGAYIAMSNSHNYFKIKYDTVSEDSKKEVIDIINSWANKHKFDIKKVDNKDTYYIVGLKN